MRSFLITLILFFVVISAITLNSHYISNLTDTIIEYTSDEEFKKAPEDALRRLESLWEKNKILVEFSIGYRECDRMSELILDLRECIETENSAEERRVRTLISDCASDISRLEKFSFENLL